VEERDTISEAGDHLLGGGEEEQGRELRRGCGEGEERKGKEGREGVAAEGGRKESCCTGREAAEDAAAEREEEEGREEGEGEGRGRSEAVVAGLPSVVDGRSEEEVRGIEQSKVGVGETREPSERNGWRKKGAGGREKLVETRRWTGKKVRGRRRSATRRERNARTRKNEERTFEL